ncbi:hypothetical protein [Dinoroseobacter sp. S76]|uniref:hypothetical protein n=1 Tax=Dinoroseobacter sp. S76 TaxID=3415124 RepID=UPI003C7ACAA7
MALRITVGRASLEAAPFERFQDYQGFVENVAPRLVPPPAPLNVWDQDTQGWKAPVPRDPLVLRPALQCMVSDGFGMRDPEAEQEMMARFCHGLQVSPNRLREAIEVELPPAVFPLDFSRVLTDEQKRRGSWEIMGQAHFEHFVLRGPVGRLGDWMLVTLAVDFTLSARAMAAPLRAANVERVPGDVAERMSEFLTRHPHGPASNGAALPGQGEQASARR